MYAIGDRDEVNRSPEGYVLPLEGYDVYEIVQRIRYHSGAKILTQNLDAGDEGWRAHPCAAKGFRGGCTEKCYGLEPGEGYSAIGREEGGDFDQCDAALMAMEKESMECEVEPCSFAGAWTTKRTTPLYGMSYFYERAQAAKAVRWPNSETKAVKITPSDYKRAGKRVCQTRRRFYLERVPGRRRGPLRILVLRFSLHLRVAHQRLRVKRQRTFTFGGQDRLQRPTGRSRVGVGHAIAVMNTFN